MLLQRLHYLQTGADGAPSVVFMRQRIAKIGQETVCKIADNMSIKVSYNCHTGIMIGSYHFWQCFRDPLAVNRRCQEQMTKQYAHLAMFGYWGGTRGC